MESTTAITGRSFSMASVIFSIDVSVYRRMLSLTMPRRLARSAICLGDSSPDTYKTVPSDANCSATCRSSVDLPIPGSPPTSATEPATRPPPRTRSRLGRFVDRRGTRSAPIAPSGMGSAEALRPSACASGLFQPLHSGQRPSHLVACAPHSVHAKIVAAFLAIAFDCSGQSRDLRFVECGRPARIRRASRPHPPCVSPGGHCDRPRRPIGAGETPALQLLVERLVHLHTGD